MQNYHFLECMDSIRAPWGTSENLLNEAHAQAFIETLLNLSLGRNIVAQQSFALDSQVFQLILSDFSRAYAEYTSQCTRKNLICMDNDPPVVLHLLKGESFRDAACIMLDRITSGLEGGSELGRPYPFYSSLYPDLDDVGELKFARTEISKGNYPSQFIRLLDGKRAQLFDDLWNWFENPLEDPSNRDRKVLRVTSNKNRASMKHVLGPIIDAGSELSVSLHQKGYDEIPAIKRVTEAMRNLDTEVAHDEQFEVRSFFYGSWVWGRGGESVKDIVGESLPDVQKLFNTLYTRTTVQAIEANSASYSTPMVPPMEAVDQFEVQQLALWSHDFALKSLPMPSKPDSFRSQSRLEVGINGSLHKPRSRVMKIYSGDQAVDAFRRILFLRLDPRWRTGIARMRVAQERGDLYGLEKAIDEHVDLVARALSGMCDVDRNESGAIQVAWRNATLTTGTLSAASAELFGCMDLKIAELVAAGAAVVLLGPPLVQAIARPLKLHRDYGTLKKALGQVISTPEASRDTHNLTTS